MKKLWLVLGILFLSVMLIGCGGVIPPPPEEIPVDIIREYTGHDYVERWADGIVNVYDGTKCEWVRDILDEINVAIDGPVVFKLSEDSNNSQIKIVFEDLTGMGQIETDVESNDDEIFNVSIKIDPLTGVMQPLYVCVLLEAVGIDFFKSVVGFTQEMKKVLYWLYKLEPGYPLI